MVLNLVIKQDYELRGECIVIGSRLELLTLNRGTQKTVVFNSKPLLPVKLSNCVMLLKWFNYIVLYNRELTRGCTKRG